MQIESIITKNHAEFRECLDKVQAAVEQNDWELAIELAQQAAAGAWLNSAGIFSSPELEALLARIGKAIPEDGAGNGGTRSETRRVLTVLSSVYSIGGHTRLAVRWMSLDRDSRHTLVVTRQGDHPVPELVTRLADEGLIELVILDDPGYVARIKHLRRLLAEHDYAVLHIHPDDPMLNVALAGMASPPTTLLVGHASHVFWLGATVSNQVVAGIEASAHINTTRRGIPFGNLSWAPIPMELDRLEARTDASEIRARYGVPSDVVLLMSSGSPYKFAPIDDVSLASLLAPVLADHADVHLLLVGPEANDPHGIWDGLPAERVHRTGYLAEPDLIDCYHACDIYLDAAPFPSNTALIEAAAIGRPVIKFAPKAWQHSGFTQDLDSIPPRSYIWPEAESYRRALSGLIAQPKLRAQQGCLVQRAVQLWNSYDAFVPAIEQAYWRAAQSPLIQLDTEAAAHRIELLDRLLQQLTQNLQLSQAKPTARFSFTPTNPQDIYGQLVASRKLTAVQLAQSEALCTCRIGVALIDGNGAPELLEQTLRSLATQSHLPADIRVLQAAGEKDWTAAFNTYVNGVEADVLLVLHAGDTLSPDAITLLSARFASQPELACCYVDEDSLADGKPAAPIFKPDINLDLLRSYAYLGQALAIHRDALQALDGLRPGLGELGHYDFVFRAIEGFGLQSIGHLGEVVHRPHRPFAEWLASEGVAGPSAGIVSAHLQRLGIPHEVQPGILPSFNRVKYLHERQPPVSVIIPTRDQLPMLNGLIDSLLAKTSYKNYELLIVDNDSQDPAACAYLDGIERLNNPQLRVLRYPHPFNYSAINNFAAREARGEYLILLNNDTAVLHEDWIEALLNHAQRPEVGIVGAKLHYPDGRIQHAGVVLGLRGPADHPFIGQAGDAPGYMHRLQVDQNYTAVTAACLMIRKSVYDEVGGLDEQDFKVSYNDVDLCLKVNQAGYLAVWTPYAQLMHEGSVSQTKVDTSAQEAKMKRFRGEQAAMYRKWLPLLARDPAYNRNLSLDGPGFDLDTGPSRSWQPFARPLAPRLFCVAADANGCGHYRVRQPFLSMQREGLAEGVIAATHLAPVYMERFAPQAMILQRQLTEQQLETMAGYKEYFRAFKVYELDDYLPNVPLKSAHRNAMPKDVMKALRKAVSLTDRFVVSTEPLAEQFADLHSDIRVLPNRLPVDWWGGLPPSARRTGRKPRVGWGGGNSHRGDLELIAEVVRDLADEVEWVFFGMCPDKLRPYVHEFHEGVPIEQYPAKLASLDLDLALAPLEDNLFNACKSNLRLLEYGACGFPVVCSDIVCYRGDLPVTRVRNRYKEWVDAIRMHVADLDAAAAAGDALREAVRRDWMLAGDNLVAWRDAWLPS